MESVRWQQCYSSEPLPLEAVLAGYDTNEDPIFVGQAHHMGNLLPAKVIPDKKCAYVSHEGEEFQKSSFQVLCCRNVSWVKPQNGSIPPNAIPGGRTTSGEELFIGRGKFNGSVTPGKLFPKDRKLYIPYDKNEPVFYFCSGTKSLPEGDSSSITDFINAIE
uniref:DUF3421 domain-containing protein n=1 Tax=Anopheles atroparvus TaxID=41427 RepID=A0A182JN32_ANOAO